MNKYENIMYDELLNLLVDNFRILNLTKNKKQFIECSDNICLLQEVLLKENKKYFEKNFGKKKGQDNN